MELAWCCQDVSICLLVSLPLGSGLIKDEIDLNFMTSRLQFCCESFNDVFGVLFGWLVCWDSFAIPTRLFLSFSFFYQTPYFPQQSLSLSLLIRFVFSTYASFCSPALRLVLLNVQEFDLVGFFVWFFAWHVRFHLNHYFPGQFNCSLYVRTVNWWMESCTGASILATTSPIRRP